LHLIRCAKYSRVVVESGYTKFRACRSTSSTCRRPSSPPPAPRLVVQMITVAGELTTVAVLALYRRADALLIGLCGLTAALLFVWVR
jgi:hypothetical protein